MEIVNGNPYFQFAGRSVVKKSIWKVELSDKNAGANSQNAFQSTYSFLKIWTLDLNLI